MDRPSILDDDEELTDPQPFGPPVSPEDVTVRRCIGCGAVIEPDSAAFVRGAVLVLNAAFAAMVRGGVARSEAAAIVDKLATDSGIST